MTQSTLDMNPVFELQGIEKLKDIETLHSAKIDEAAEVYGGKIIYSNWMELNSDISPEYILQKA